jgi:hypothetical protein
LFRIAGFFFEVGRILARRMQESCGRIWQQWPLSSTYISLEFKIEKVINNFIPLYRSSYLVEARSTIMG